jgi:hypothetical protein
VTPPRTPQVSLKRTRTQELKSQSLTFRLASTKSPQFTRHSTPLELRGAVSAEPPTGWRGDQDLGEEQLYATSTGVSTKATGFQSRSLSLTWTST